MKSESCQHIYLCMYNDSTLHNVVFIWPFVYTVYVKKYNTVDVDQRLLSSCFTIFCDTNCVDFSVNSMHFKHHYIYR